MPRSSATRSGRRRRAWRHATSCPVNSTVRRPGTRAGAVRGSGRRVAAAVTRSSRPAGAVARQEGDVRRATSGGGRRVHDVGPRRSRSQDVGRLVVEDGAHRPPPRIGRAVPECRSAGAREPRRAAGRDVPRPAALSVIGSSASPRIPRANLPRKSVQVTCRRSFPVREQPQDGGARPLGIPHPRLRGRLHDDVVARRHAEQLRPNLCNAASGVNGHKTGMGCGGMPVLGRDDVGAGTSS